jgi:hypothetical protein
MQAKSFPGIAKHGFLKEIHFKEFQRGAKPFTFRKQV